ncbi:hypothetical protein GUJ93_ZPchr0008g11463 [Zizania palustris]|uniref:Uncharacterized protein n=1 Tax=Zizania palustris TaxID=103762 RepID=A0A8J5RUY3_ZIZPA|nr:hypothetical protein GUJ93_ZPchr0008g11463 [Zizania palustris]
MCHAVKRLFCGTGVHPTVHELDLDPRGRELERVMARLVGYGNELRECPRELLAVLREARCNSVRLRALQQREKAALVVEIERRFKVFDDLIQRRVVW